MNDVFITSDEHYQSDSIIKICKRPFANSIEMNEALIANHNSVVKKGDRVYHLGDIFVGRRVDASLLEAKKIMRQLNGQHYLILGNHDEIAKWMPENFVWSKDLFDLKVQPYPMMVLTHYALRSWRNRIHGSWHLYGHSHCQLPGLGYSFDIGVDCHDFMPWSVDEIADKMRKIRTSNSPEDLGVKNGY